MGDGRLDDLDVTREELDSIGEALKSEQFRKLLCEYVDEINDPANRAQYELEVTQYERERGAEVTFVRPRPGYAVKTSADGVRKVFVNVCACDAVDKPTVDAGRRWSLPHCLSPVRRDYDNARRPCDVYDVMFHPDVLGLAGRDRAIRDMVEDTALTVIEKNNGVVLDRANVKYPKISFKGVARPLVIRRRIDGFRPCAADAGETELPPPGCPPYEPPVDRPVQHHDLDASTREKSPFAVPKYVIKYRSDMNIQEHAYDKLCKMNAVIPKQLIVEINLPLLDSSANVQLDVLSKSLTLVCHKPSKYRLDVGLPYSVLDDQGDATFDQSTRKLIVRLPVLRTEPSLDYARRPVEELRTTVADGEPENGEHRNASTTAGPESSDAARDNDNDDDDDEVAAANGLPGENTVCDGEGDVHYTLPEHEFIYGNNCVLTLHVKNIDPTSIDLIVVDAERSVSGKFHNVGSGFFPIWFAFCIRIPSGSRLLNSDLKVIPSDNNLVLEFSARFKPDCKRYWYGLDRDHLTIRRIKTGALEETQNTLANGVPDCVNDSDDDCDDDNDNDDVFDDGKRETASNGGRRANAEKRDDGSRCKDGNGKTAAKEKGKKKKSKKIQKSNAIPIVVAGGLSESGRKVDFVAGSLPIEFNNTRPTIRGILKKRSLSECSNADETLLYNRIYSSSVDNVDTESSDVLESSLNDLGCKKTVRFNDHVIEKKINSSLSVAAQAKKHRQRQQRKRNIREYSTPSESEASEAEDKAYGPLNVVSESEETSVSESSAGEMSDDSSNGTMTTISSKVTIVSDSKKDHKRRKSKSARKNASLAKQALTNSLIFPIEY